MSEGKQMPMVSRGERFWQWLHRWALWWLLAMLFFFGYDIFYDALSDGADFHVVMEGLTFCAVTAVLVVEWRRNKWLSLSLEEASQHSQRLSGQFSEYVRTAFAGWSLSRSEQEVAWLLLKGFSFAEIANLRGVQEKTVRQQATGVYAKSGCKNRNEFLAHFIQDLLEAEHLTAEPVPVEPAGTPATSAEPTIAAGSAGPTSASARAPE
jgi:DNA-binding CsgD family transcriptional regulator